MISNCRGAITTRAMAASTFQIIRRVSPLELLVCMDAPADVSPRQGCEHKPAKRLTMITIDFHSTKDHSTIMIILWGRLRPLNGRRNHLKQ